MQKKMEEFHQKMGRVVAENLELRERMQVEIEKVEKKDAEIQELSTPPTAFALRSKISYVKQEPLCLSLGLFGNDAVLRTCNDSDGQHWVQDILGYIHNKARYDKCLIPEVSSRFGIAVVVDDCNKQINSKFVWDLEPDHVVHVETGKMMKVNVASNNDIELTEEDYDARENEWDILFEGGFPPSYLTGEPSVSPSRSPSSAPSESPSAVPTSSPSARPSSVPSASPSSRPSSSPSSSPTSMPSSKPSSAPTSQPSSQPSAHPSATPTGKFVCWFELFHHNIFVNLNILSHICTDSITFGHTHQFPIFFTKSKTVICTDSITFVETYQIVCTDNIVCR